MQRPDKEPPSLSGCVFKPRLSIDGSTHAAGGRRRRMRVARTSKDGPMAALVKLQEAHGNLASRYVIDKSHRLATVRSILTPDALLECPQAHPG